jgi:para-nitrobenzyl esterase
MKLIISNIPIAVLVALLIVLNSAGCSHNKAIPSSVPDLAKGRITNQVVAVTDKGRIAGRVEPDGFLTFLGIPYAEPPVGDLRFEKLQPVKPWKGILKAHTFGPVFPQSYDKTEPSSLYLQDEDCLTLNIWTPAVDNGKRPVMVYIHGGGYLWGSGMDPLYDCGNIARRGKIVAVNFNYRMGALGYLDLSAVGGEAYADSGNLAVLDQITALTWVHDNIAAFGGDPDNVTIFGESAGAGSVSTLLSVSQVQGLFKNAISESGAIRITRSKEYAQDITRRFMELAGVSDIKGLKDLPAKDFFIAQQKLLKEAGLATDRLFGPVRDGRVVPVDPIKAISEGSAKNVSLLTGTTEDEARFWIKYEPLLPYIPASVLLTFTPDTKGWDSATKTSVIDFYKKKMPDAKTGDIGLAIATDFFFRMPQIHLAEAQAGFGNTWMYLFTWDSPIDGGVYGSRHALELRFVLDNKDAEVGDNPPASLTENMMDSWIAFAKTGNPNHMGIPDWPKYDTRARATMLFNEKCRVVDDPGSEERIFWEKTKPTSK